MVSLRLTWLRQPGVQRLLALAALIVLGLGHYVLSRLPMPVALETVGGFDSGAASEIVIDQALERPGLLLVFEGDVGDAIDLRLDRGRLQASTADLLQRLGVALPAGDHPMSLLARRADDTKTFLRVTVVPTPGRPSRVTLKSPREAGDYGMGLVMRAEGARLQVSLIDAGSPSPDMPQSQRTLRLAGRELPVMTGAVPLSLLAAADSEIRLRIVPAVRNWEDVQRLALAPADHRDAALTLFGLGVRNVLQGQFTDYACAAASRVPLATPHRLADGRCPAGKDWLRLVSLEFRPGQVSAEASGQAWLRRNDATHTLDLLTWLKENPILAALIGALDAAVLAWCKQVFFSDGGGGGLGLGGPGDDTRHSTPRLHS